MRFYPFGSGSSPLIVVSSSFADYAATARYGILANSASLALSGSTGAQGPIGACLYVSGSSGSQGPIGPQGSQGTVYGPVE